MLQHTYFLLNQHESPFVYFPFSNVKFALCLLPMKFRPCECVGGIIVLFSIQTQCVSHEKWNSISQSQTFWTDNCFFRLSLWFDIDEFFFYYFRKKSLEFLDVSNRLATYSISLFTRSTDFFPISISFSFK